MDNITGNVIWGDKDPNLSPDYMNILFKYLREKKKLHVNNILVKDSGPLSREESLENLSLILNNFLFHWQNHREIPKFDF